MKSLIKKVPSFSTKGKAKAKAAASTKQLENSPAATEDSDESRSEVNSSASPPRLPSLRPIRLGSYDFDTADSTPYIYPSLYDEASTMIDLSNLIYTLAELRELARNGVLSDPTKSLRIMDLPLPMETAMAVIKGEAELLQEVLGDGAHGAALSALESVMMKDQLAKSKKEAADGNNNTDSTKSEESSGLSSWFNTWDGCLGGGFSFDELLDNMCGDASDAKSPEEVTSPHNQHRDVSSSTIYQMGDLKSNDELVYAIGVNPAEERITVVFRGSVTKTDFLTDANINLMQAPDPYSVAEDSESEEVASTVGIHRGFYDYLFAEKDGKPSKYVEIMKHVEELVMDDVNRRQNYKLYVTGHSLGGALATLFGFYAAARVGTLPLPITVVSVASPKVGNIEFARRFAEMESQGKIRHLRIANHRDPVTLAPSVSSKKVLAVTAMAFSPLGYLALKASGNTGDERDVFYHTGIKMKLRKEVPEGGQLCELSYSGASLISGSTPIALEKDDQDLIKENIEKIKKKMKSTDDVPMVQYHFGSAYSERIALVENELKELKLNDLYLEKAAGQN
mmetsp:Transcript_5825/g.8438  ORF Transcript_5825/g.8438 Transcript_5825/m.8438 type:complete len:566 (-) Transcript_5825:136-1833(-)|eukprot:CAMPEP_0201697818 /NCGR_PEP_ID=MMETSP0578-20130828/14196_1 /ASSEMBLY_ACC=CAM_ASM_000663 /TAXON_ID=267565 /ORGANISM="Skeletonema grethea, Strain CCMP 1804" /LENGTH=565 /DNA_ID=CAMNT_0048184147 /DNA_START=167 /DNA_END=1864 /DNA_ORIENTATION=+